MDFCNLMKEHYEGAFPTRQEFLDSCQPQNFISFPKPLIKYISLNPINKEGYLKLAKTCKYIFLEYPILLIEAMEHSKNECEGGRILLEECLNLQNTSLIPLNKIKAKFWMYDFLEIAETDKQKMNLFISKIFRCEIKDLQLQSSTLLFEHFKTICSELVKTASIGSVKYSDGSEAPIEKLVEFLPNLNCLQYCFSSMSLQFFQSYHLQDFTLPDSVIYYITQKPSKPKSYQKLIQSCKYFFCKNPILVFHSLCFKDNEWKTCINGTEYADRKKINFNISDNTVAKLWIINTVTVIPIYENEIITSSIIRKLYKYDDILVLTLQQQVLTIDELLLFSSSVEELIFHLTLILSKNGSVISIPKIMDSFPRLKVFHFGFGLYNASIFTPNTVKEILKIPHFYQLTQFTLVNIPETFDIYTFYEYLKKNNTTEYNLIFIVKTIPQEYRNRLDIIVDEILSNEFRNYKVPYIAFPGMDAEKKKKLKELSGSYLKKY